MTAKEIRAAFEAAKAGAFVDVMYWHTVVMPQSYDWLLSIAETVEAGLPKSAKALADNPPIVQAKEGER